MASWMDWLWTILSWWRRRCVCRGRCSRISFVGSRGSALESWSSNPMATPVVGSTSSYFKLRPGPQWASRCGLKGVASGRLDCFWEFHLQPWDLAAGRLLVQEAGGRMTDAEGNPHRLDSPSILASNGHLHDQLLQAFGEISSGKYQAELPAVNRRG